MTTRVTSLFQSQEMLVNYGMLLILATLWGGSFMLIKVSVHDLSPMVITSGRLFLGALVIYIYLKSRKLSLSILTRGQWIACLAMGFVGNALPFGFISWGEQYVPAGLSAILMAITPLVAPFIGYMVIRHEKPGWRRVIGLCVGFIAMIILVGFDALEGLGQNLIAQLLIAAAAVCYAIASVILRTQKGLPAMEGSCITLLCGALITAPFAVLDQPWLMTPSNEAVWAVILLGIFTTAIPSILLFIVMHRTDVTFVAQVNFMVPICGVLWGVLLLGERLSWNAYAALAIVLIALTINATHKLPGSAK